MSKRMLIDGAHSEEIRVVVSSGNRLEEYDIETTFKKQIKGNIYLAKVTRVEPSLQAAFVDFGGNRHGFLAFSEIHPDYYQIPVEDRQALIEEQEALEMKARAAREHLEDMEGDFEDDDESTGPAADAAPDDPDADDPDADEPDADESDGATAEFDENAEDGAADGDGAQNDGEAAGRADAGDPGDEDTGDEDTGDEDSGDEADAYRDEETHEGERPDPMPMAADPEAEEVLEAAETAAPRRTRGMRRYKIQEVIKRRQILLVQVVKEERGNKGAALTTYISLAGRYCVLMPNSSRGGGISRKITSVKERRKLRDTLNAMDVPEGMGVIIRTAGLERSKAEIRRDFEYLIRAWDEVRTVTLESTAPSLVYEEGNIIKRAIRDVYTKDLDEILIEGNEVYQTAKRFMRLMMPSHAKRVQPYRDETIPLFQRFQIEQQLDAMHNPEVQLKSGGYIVINPTEALVAIDVNSGRSTRERNIEETALKTNIEAADEVARQLRLRDLAGLIVIDFIDMEDGRNVRKVERRLRDAMKIDRARLQIGHISNFGLLELSRQRLRPSLLETSSQICPHCRGTGNILSTESMAMRVLRAIEEEGIRMRSSEITVRVPTAVALYILNHKRASLVDMERRYGFQVMLEGDDTVIPPDVELDRVKGRPEPAPGARAPQTEAPEEADADEDEDLADEEEEDAAETAESARDDDAPKRGRRRRGRRRGRDDESRSGAEIAEAADETPADGDGEAAETEDASADGDEKGGARRRRRGRRGGRRRNRGGPREDGDSETPEAAEGDADASADRTSAEPESELEEAAMTATAELEAQVETPFEADEMPESEAEVGAEAGEKAEEPAAETADEDPARDAGIEAEAEADPAEDEAGEDEAPEPEASPAPIPEREMATTAEPGQPKRRGWWQRIVE